MFIYSFKEKAGFKGKKTCKYAQSRTGQAKIRMMHHLILQMTGGVTSIDGSTTESRAFGMKGDG